MRICKVCKGPMPVGTPLAAWYCRTECYHAYMQALSDLITAQEDGVTGLGDKEDHLSDRPLAPRAELIRAVYGGLDEPTACPDCGVGILAARGTKVLCECGECEFPEKYNHEPSAWSED